MKKIKAGIVEVNKFFCDGLKLNLDKLDNIIVVFIVTSFNDLIEKLKKYPCDLLLIGNFSMETEFIKTTKNILSEYPFTKIILIGFSGYENHIDEIIENGIKGIISKENCHNELFRTIDLILAGFHFFCEESLKYILKAKKNITSNDLQFLTKRETEILILFAKGFSIKEISKKLFIACKTVSNHKASIKEKTGIKENSDFKIFALKNNLL